MSFILGNTSCQLQNVSHFGSGCNVYVVDNGDSLTLTKAREKCLEGGGDLATFEDDEDLKDFKSQQMQHLVKEKYWIGLFRILWTWNITGILKLTIFVPFVSDLQRLLANEFLYIRANVFRCMHAYERHIGRGLLVFYQTAKNYIIRSPKFS